MRNWKFCGGGGVKVVIQNPDIGSMKLIPIPHPWEEN